MPLTSLGSINLNNQLDFFALPSSGRECFLIQHTTESEYFDFAYLTRDWRVEGEVVLQIPYLKVYPNLGKNLIYLPIPEELKGTIYEVSRIGMKIGKQLTPNPWIVELFEFSL